MLELERADTVDSLVIPKLLCSRKNDRQRQIGRISPYVYLHIALCEDFWRFALSHCVRLM